ncbi:hypothetical protein CDAR_487621 [Caerostris darwini]|uniref:Uncharacterized protein n=1 Tax=Caerostris darwini TaxID=1538125 RepID=A0AAV4PTI1_9ARAC|nr:hypothetical protein CDAR_487621 [Caerostris darwini]
MYNRCFSSLPHRISAHITSDSSVRRSNLLNESMGFQIVFCFAREVDASVTEEKLGRVRIQNTYTTIYFVLGLYAWNGRTICEEDLCVSKSDAWRRTASLARLHDYITRGFGQRQLPAIVRDIPLPFLSTPQLKLGQSSGNQTEWRAVNHRASETVKTPSVLLSLQLLGCPELLLALKGEMELPKVTERARKSWRFNDVVAIIDTCVPLVRIDKLLLPITSCRRH